MSEETKIVGDLSVDKSNLYREESLTDLKVASLRRLTPIKVDGSDDPDRPTLYIGETQLMSQRGPLPIQAPIEASSLIGSLGGIAELAKAAFRMDTGGGGADGRDRAVDGGTVPPTPPA